MIRLVRAALRARWGAAVVTFLLAAVAAGAAAAGPLYQRVARASATGAEVSAAPVVDRVISLDRQLPTPHSLSGPSPPAPLRELPVRPGFETVAGLWMPAGVGGDIAGRRPEYASALAYRGRVCAHVVMVAGRCPSGAGEGMIAERGARRLGLAPGRPITLLPGEFFRSGFSPNGEAVVVTIVGVYRQSDPTEAYWAGRSLFGGAADTPSVGTVFATQETVYATSVAQWLESVDLIAGRSAFDDPAAVRDAVQDLQVGMEQPRFVERTRVTELADRIDAGRQRLRDSLRLAAVPLLVLSWWVLYLAVCAGARRHRVEGGMFALRGVPWPVRLGLPAVEQAVPIVLGAPVGVLGGLLAIRAVSAAALPDAPAVPLGRDALWHAALAVCGALAVGVAAQWRAANAPVAALLRDTPARIRAAAVRAVDVVAAVLAAAAAYQVLSAGSDATGLVLLLPLFVSLAAGLLGARLFGVVSAAAGRRALRRGALARGLAGLQWAREPGRPRLLALVTVVFAVTGFAAAGADVAATARLELTRLELGAPRVLSVQPIGEQQLLRAVREADPRGRYAMAASRVSGSGFAGLAVDAQRLARVAYWDRDYGALGAAEAARLLHPAPTAPLVVRGTEIALRLTVAAAPESAVLRVGLRPQRGDAIRTPGTPLLPGTRWYRFATSGCAAGCQLGAIEAEFPVGREYTVDLTVLALTGSEGGTPRPVAPERFADPARWRGPAAGPLAAARISGAGGGVRIAYTGTNRPDVRIVPVTTPVPVPVLWAGPAPPQLSAGDGGGAALPLARVAPLAAAPGAGSNGLIDMEYLDLAAYTRDPAQQPQVWLTADAPPALIGALEEAGLVIERDTALAAQLRLAGTRGAALALLFYLVAAAAAGLVAVAALAVVTAADLAPRADQLRTLRVQGLRRGALRRAELTIHLGLVAAAAMLGTAAGALAWALARSAVPILGTGPGPLPPPAWPGPAAALGPALTLSVLCAAGVAATAALIRAVDGGAGNGRAR